MNTTNTAKTAKRTKRTQAAVKLNNVRISEPVQAKTKEQLTAGDTLLTLIEKNLLTREQLIEHINTVIAGAHQTGLDDGYDQALFDMGTQQIAG